MLMLWWGGMLVFLQLFDDVARHGKVEGACIVIPLEVDAAVEIAVPILCEFIFFLYAPNEVVNVFLTCIFYPKLSTTSVKEIEHVTCIQRPGVCVHL